MKKDYPCGVYADENVSLFPVYLLILERKNQCSINHEHYLTHINPGVYPDGLCYKRLTSPGNSPTKESGSVEQRVTDILLFAKYGTRYKQGYDMLLSSRGYRSEGKYT